MARPPCAGVCASLVARGRVRVAAVVAAFLFSVYQIGPRAGRNAGQTSIRGNKPVSCWRGA